MRMTKYKLQLIKESSTNYGGQNINLSSPSEVYRVLCDVCDLDKQAEEVLMLICLDSKNKVVAYNGKDDITKTILLNEEIRNKKIINH